MSEPNVKRALSELEPMRDGFVRLHVPWGNFRYRLRDPHRRSRSRSWRLREQRWQRVRRARMRHCLERLEVHIITEELEEAVAAGRIQRAEGGCYQALPATVTPSRRKIEFQRLWLAGMPVVQIARELGTTPSTLSTLKHRMAREGWNVPTRYKMDGKYRTRQEIDRDFV